MVAERGCPWADPVHPGNTRIEKLNSQPTTLPVGQISPTKCFCNTTIDAAQAASRSREKKGPTGALVAETHCSLMLIHHRGGWSGKVLRRATSAGAVQRYLMLVRLNDVLPTQCVQRSSAKARISRCILPFENFFQKIMRLIFRNEDCYAAVI